MPHRALCIEPSASLRDVLASLLRDAGWEAELCADLSEVMPALLRRKVDLVITAAQLPAGDYGEVLKRFRDGSISGACPIVLLTSDIDARIVSTALVKGITEVFAKSDLPALRAYLDALRVSDGGQFNGLNALVLEDDISMALYLGQVLGELGMNVERHVNIDGALAAATSGVYDLIIVDIVLGAGESGNHFVRLLRSSSSPGRNVPVIAVSGYGDRARRLDALRSGANLFLTKPLEEEELLLTIRRLLGEDALATDTLLEVAGNRRFDLSKRELAICKLVASGLSDKRIAEQLGISYWTVRTHLASTFRKCGVMNRVELANLLRQSENRESDAREAGVGLAQCVIANFANAVLVTDRKRRMVYVNQAFMRITGYDEAEALGNSPAMIGSDRHSPRFFLDMLRQLDDQGHWSGEVWNRRKNGALFLAWLEIRELPPGSPLGAGYMAVMTDITENHAEFDRIRHYALHDAVTGLGNRTLLEHHWRNEVARAKRANGRIGLLCIDIDRFRLINEALGNERGDQLLATAAARIRECMRDHDTVTRLAGDKFLVLVPDLVGRDFLLSLAGKLLTVLRAPVEIGGSECQMAASVGIGVYPDDGSELPEVIACAEAALCRAKEAGGNSARLFGGGDGVGRSYRRSVEPRFDQADLELRFQPRVDLATAGLVGAESQLRWHDPERAGDEGDLYVSFGERNSYAIDLFEWALQETCLSLRRLQARQPRRFSMALKVPAVQLMRRNFVVDVASVLARNGVPAERLQLAVAEAAWLREPQRARQVLGELRDLRVSLALDGFGSGASRLDVFRDLPFDTLKLDRALVGNIQGDRYSGAVAGAVVKMATDFAINVVADGVDTGPVATVLRDIGCQQAQGELFGGALSEPELRDQLSAV